MPLSSSQRKMCTLDIGPIQCVGFACRCSFETRRSRSLTCHPPTPSRQPAKVVASRQHRGPPFPLSMASDPDLPRSGGLSAVSRVDGPIHTSLLIGAVPISSFHGNTLTKCCTSFVKLIPPSAALKFPARQARVTSSGVITSYSTHLSFCSALHNVGIRAAGGGRSLARSALFRHPARIVCQTWASPPPALSGVLR